MQIEQARQRQIDLDHVFERYLLQDPLQQTQIAGRQRHGGIQPQGGPLLTREGDVGGEFGGRRRAHRAQA
jgi:hypothetical protein